ncbi:hypothetical protein HNR63_001055 [Anoxybacillus kamchatkensis]|uniref:hypothetical protein n=1 Tax=Anoxybacillus ayderensis TaxID=265546 RepID=UPI0015ECD0B8|nr:hypothetical protein [Anoxybacillus ayderensis]MBA2878001.1 hypothetical protein [Anoxybacillus ayderensis]
MIVIGMKVMLLAHTQLSDELEFLRCKRDLDELIKRKEEHDRLMQVVEMMKERGVDIAIVMRKGNE